ncbi:acetoacetate decarboxylase [Streptoalloteichus tenebrarius]|uniref:Acetoacetate decarboxylase n=1 Tax=Streptoalloteichus tenebrarius (strain ATCC 17920 / DSM 40477 / JCM 4838 / CBS 697.72 / NBRC 16177 / NCIMB 11028 / NRRL B-12390 / A12253. 1 / ISP 5477) TaxID=1933 RepID=A0ABT1HLR3_STRSD|nr:enduracididine biosynthesis enzyme MppR [Streptoalloteichus tenebrarius]MCP2256438.1 acetoacetate decarboxylase [Streptoalloteichus tenebrarius]BFF04790.1 acetoacetate decarboxylase family protein [Streptoalloteichus tenebrarius]
MTTTAPAEAGPTGYSLPLSPTGASAMLTPPPWHFSGDVIMVDYRVDPEAAARFLPPGLSLGADPGAAAAVFAEWQWCSESGEELDDPQRSQFTEFLILLACEYEGVPMARCPYAWVDSPVPMMRGWVQGMPKQFGSVHQTRPKSVGLAGPKPNAPGRHAGTLSVHGRRVAEMAVRAERRIEQPPLLHTVPLVHTRVFPTWTSSAPPVAELVSSEVTGVEFGEIWAGGAELRFPSPLDDDFAGLAPVEIGQGYVFAYAETLCGGRLLQA